MDFAVGQECIYKGAIMPSSRVVIGRIDPGLAPGERIISVTITDVPLPDPQTRKLEPGDIAHVPIDAKAFESSIVRCSGSLPVPPGFDKGYRTWREAFDKRQAGVFTLQLGEIQHVIAETLAPADK